LRISCFGRHALKGCAVLALLVGCGGGGATVSPEAGSLPAEERSAAGPLLYAVENDATVQIYSYPKPKLVATLTGFGDLYGACADQMGDAFIVDYAKAAVFEYAAGGTVPIAVLSDPGYTPTGCSVDPTTGNVAVTSLYAKNYTTGTVAVYALGNSRSPALLSAPPTLLTDSDIFEPRFCGYDAIGNLSLDGYSKTLAIEFAELPRGSSQFTNLTLNQTIGEPGSVQWDGTYLAIGDASTNIIYQFSIDGSVGTEMGATTLNGVTYGLNQFWIENARVVGAAAVDDEVGVWKYPAGGSALRVIKQNGSYAPIGVTVSTGASH
jgi:hypothetical protein